MTCGGFAGKVADILQRKLFGYDEMNGMEDVDWKEDEIERKGDQKEEGGCKGRRGGVRQGVLMAAGAITGEAVVGIILAIPIVISQDVYVMAITGGPPTGIASVILGFLWLVGFSALLAVIDIFGTIHVTES